MEFYDPEEDDDNEKWVAEMMKKASGGGEAKTTYAYLFINMLCAFL